MHKHIVIVAGEESGDKHASRIVAQLKQSNPEITFSGIGGKHMQDAGVDVINHLANFGVTGITEVLRHFKTIKEAFKLIKAHLNETKPQILLLIDYPGFNLRLAKYAKEKLNLKIIYYISPQIWAWKANRINTIKKYIDVMAVILPFEKTIYERNKVTAYFVGHPLVEKLNTIQPYEKIRVNLNLPLDKKIIALLPGSRIQEIERHLPIMLRAAQDLIKQHTNLHFVLPIALTIEPKIIEQYTTKTDLPLSLIRGDAQNVIKSADCVIVASGTASLECALLEKPMCIIYKASFITYLAATIFIRVKYLGLCNLLLQKMIVPELLQYDCNETELFNTVDKLLTDHNYKEQMIVNLQKMRDILNLKQADLDITTLIKNNINI